MIGMINAVTSTRMWVSDERKEEYLALGHTLLQQPGKEMAKEKKLADKKTKE